MATCYASCGCNRTPHAADWGRNGLICYGSCRAVILYHPKEPAKIIATVPHHSHRVNSCKWIRREGDEDELLSSSTDKTIGVWKYDRDSKEKITLECLLKGHTDTVTLAKGVYVHGDDGDVSGAPRTLIASASVDSTVRIWERKAGQVEFQCVQTLSFGTGFILDITWTILPGTTVPVLICGGDDQRIHVFVEQKGQMISIQTLVGHEDWIRALTVVVDDSGDVVLASTAQDCYIRIWRISPRNPDEVHKALSIAELSIEEDIKLKENTFTVSYNDSSLCYAVTLESVLHGHENLIYSLKWQPWQLKDGKCHQPMCLLSASLDKTMVLWRPDPETGLWVEHVRVGEVGGGNLGFYGGVFSPDGRSILSHGFQGAFHIWHQQEESESWLPGVTTGGHFDSVHDITWNESGDYLLSTSSDQTTRLHAHWKSNNSSESCWHEVARPQVHGYDMQCMTMINNVMFASGADEKVVRVFGASRNFLGNFSKICQVDLSDSLNDQESASIPEGASVPALGLSNKAVYGNETQEYVPTEGREVEANPNAQYPEIYFSPLSLTQPPSEDNLLQNTLWPELQKLYGHGYEVFALACHPNGSVLASSCKASKAEHAFIILWDVKTWKQICQLSSHSLTITQLAFSHSGDYLLSVSRDRTWSLFKHTGDESGDGGPLYERVGYTDKKTAVHSRIIWSCDWSHDDTYFVTVSRDKKAVIWSHMEKASDQSSLGGYKQCGSAYALPESITAVAFAPRVVGTSYLIAMGLENGRIHVVKWNPPKEQEQSKWQKVIELNNSEAHHLTVKRLKFCPKIEESSNTIKLASCGLDHMVKIYDISLA